MPGPDEAAVPNWAKIDQQIMETYHYTLHQVWDLTIPEINTHLANLANTVSEPRWFIDAWRRGGPKEKLLALQRLFTE